MNPNDNQVPPVPQQPQVPPQPNPVQPTAAQPQFVQPQQPVAPQPQVPPQPVQAWPQPAQPLPQQPTVSGPMGPMPQQPPQPFQPVNGGAPMAAPAMAAAGQNFMPSSGSKSKMVAIIVATVALVAIVALAVLFLGHKNNNHGGSTASSGGSSSSGGGTTKTACQLYALSDAQAILGSSAQSITVPKASSQFPGATSNTGCEYTNSSQNSVIIGVLDFDNSSDASSAFSKAVSNFTQLSGGTTTQVSGYGDKATYVSNGVLVVQKGTTVFDIFNVGSSPQSQDEQVASTMLSRF